MRRGVTIMLPFSKNSVPHFEKIQDVILFSHQKAVDEVHSIFSRKDFNIEDLMSSLIRDYGLQHIDIIMRTIVSLMGRYRDYPVEGGELVSLEESDFEIGLEIFERNTVNMSLVYPVLAYALTYARYLLTTLSEESPLWSGELFPQNLDFSDKITTLVAIGVHHRFWYLHHLDIQRILWGDTSKEQESMDSEILLKCVEKIPALWSVPHSTNG